MSVGNRIMELRRKNNLSQEELAEQVGVSRQTISKWELGETSPDLKQAKELSRVFKVSIDELADNDYKETIVEKVSNTEKLAGLIISILKVLGILFIVLLVIEVISLIIFSVVRSSQKVEYISEEIELICSMNEETYKISVSSDKIFNCDNCSDNLKETLEKNYIDFNDLDITVNNIEKYFISNNGNCG